MFPKFGITVDGLFQFISFVGGYDALVGLTVHDVCENFVKPFTVVGSRSYCDLVKIFGRSTIDTANVYVIHPWNGLFLDLVDALDHESGQDRTILFWIDLFSLPQNVTYEVGTSTWEGGLADLIHSIDRVVLAVTPWDGTDVYKRTWILFELFLTSQRQQGISSFSLISRMDESDRFHRALKSNFGEVFIQRSKNLDTLVDLELSSSTEFEDSERLVEHLGRLVGNLSEVKLAVRKLMRVWLKDVPIRGESKRNELRRKMVLAIALRDSEHMYRDAQELFEDILSERRKALGNASLDTLESIDALADLLRRTGQFEAAKTLFHESLNTRTHVQGPEHLDTLTSLDSFALVHMDLRQRNEALYLVDKSLEARHRLLGLRHDLTIANMELLEGIYKTMVTCGDTLPLYGSMTRLGSWFHQIGRHREARRLLEDSLGNRILKLGKEHPDTLSSMFALGEVFLDIDMVPEALNLLHQVYHGRQEKLGRGHADTQLVLRVIVRAQDLMREGKQRESRLKTLWKE
jgi:tetratricopeptide (TPR) repeat protein